MTCYYPNAAFLGEDGKIHLGHERRGIPAVRTFDLPCGKCIGCKLHRAREWAIRCMHEAKCYDENCFVTLTYDNDHLPPDGSLNHKHFQDFMKRLRKHYSGRTIRYYMCGEYGENMGRPHYHAVFFNLRFADQLYFKSSGGFKLYTSRTLNQLWTLGQNNLIGEVTLESAGYVARYCTKVITGDRAKKPLRPVQPRNRRNSLQNSRIRTNEQQITSSGHPRRHRRPWAHKHLTDIYPSDEVIVNGKPQKPPRYYDTILKRVQTDDLEGYVSHKRYKTALKIGPDNTPERLRVKEEIKYAQLKLKKRTL